MKAPFAKCIFKAYPQGSITQYFGENIPLYSPMGLNGHNGLDYVAPHGTPMVAVEDGVVLDVRLDEKGYGRHVRILGKAKRGVCNEWTYGHCHTIEVKVGDEVKEGQQIATMGNTGFVVSDNNGNGFWKFNPHAGTHLHLGLRKAKRDPKGWSYPGSKIKILVPDYNNGWKGSIDSLPLFTKSVAPDIANLEAQVSLLTKVRDLLLLKKQIT